jgi:hypothetical protein
MLPVGRNAEMLLNHNSEYFMNHYSVSLLAQEWQIKSFKFSAIAVTWTGKLTKLYLVESWKLSVIFAH